MLGCNVTQVRDNKGETHIKLSNSDFIRRMAKKFLRGTEYEHPSAHDDVHGTHMRTIDLNDLNADATADMHTHGNTKTETAQFHENKCLRIPTPFPPDEKVDLLDCSPTDSKPTFDYRGLVGSLQWATTTTRPDTAFATSQLARVQARPGQKHWAMALRTAAYLAQTADHGVWYHQTKSRNDHCVLRRVTREHSRTHRCKRTQGRR